MNDVQTEKMLYIATCAGENPERAAMPFVMANAALAMEMEAVIALQGTGVYLAQKGYAEKMAKARRLSACSRTAENLSGVGGQAPGLCPLHQRTQYR